jgi:hypothetical protein
MTRDDIIRMAREAGIIVIGEAVWELCALVAAAEREACAQVCDRATEANSYQGNDWTLSSCAKAIRARGKK